MRDPGLAITGPQTTARFLIRYLWIVIITVAAGGIAGWQLGSERPPDVFEATTVVLVQDRRSLFDITQIEINTRNQQIMTYGILVRTNPIFEGASERLAGRPTAGEISSKITVATGGVERILRVTARDADPVQAVNIANAVTEEFIERTTNEGLAEIARFEITAAAQGVTGIGEVISRRLEALDSFLIVERATAKRVTFSSTTQTRLLLGLFLGLGLGVAIAYGVNRFRDVVSDISDVERLLPIEALTQIPLSARSGIISGQGFGERNFLEAISFLRASIAIKTNEDQPLRSLLLTSGEPGAGKSTVSWYLAKSFALTGERTILIQADLRHPSGIGSDDDSSKKGLGHFLADEDVKLKDILVPGEEKLLSIVRSGGVLPNPSALFLQHRIKMAISEASQLADRVIVDSPPAQAVAEAALIATAVDGVVIVVAAGKTRSSVVRETYKFLLGRNANIIGTALNKWKPGFLDRYYTGSHGYYYNYDYYGDQTDHHANGVSPGRLSAVVRRVTRAASHVIRRNRQ